MLVKFDCRYCDAKGEIDVDDVAFLNGDAEELCPECASVISQEDGEIYPQ